MPKNHVFVNDNYHPSTTTQRHPLMPPRQPSKPHVSHLQQIPRRSPAAHTPSREKFAKRARSHEKILPPCAKTSNAPWPINYRAGCERSCRVVKIKEQHLVRDATRADIKRLALLLRLLWRQRRRRQRSWNPASELPLLLHTRSIVAGVVSALACARYSRYFRRSY